MASILLIDDDDYENVIVTRLLSNKFRYGFYLDFAQTLDEALNLLMKRRYDYVLLDDRLSASINSKISVKLLREHLNAAELIIISNNIYQPHLLDKAILKVTDIVHKDDLPLFVNREIHA